MGYTSFPESVDNKVRYIYIYPSWKEGSRTYVTATVQYNTNYLTLLHLR